MKKTDMGLRFAPLAASTVHRYRLGMKKVFMVAISFLFSSEVNAASDWEKIKSDDVMTWPRSTLPDFGCFLEKKFKHRDPRFNCDLKNYLNKGDPCKNTDAYYEGFEFPQELVPKIHSQIQRISLAWERGSLQAINLHFKSRLKETDIRKSFGLPQETFNPRPNVMSYSIQDCHKDYNCLLLQGFDHMGAGDVDCSAM